MLKKCSKCDKTKTTDEFYLHKAGKRAGFLSCWCKECHRDNFRNYYHTNREEQLKRLKSEASYKARKKWRDKNPEKIRAYNRKSTKKWKESNPSIVKAHEMANYAVERGKLIRQPCGVCGNPNTEFHHDDYSKPLKVRDLCKPCHVELHKQKKALQIA